MRHFTRKPPAKNHGFSWGRFPFDGGVTYRLFRRDDSNALHFEQMTFPPHALRADIARVVRRMRHELRDSVDEIDLQLMGVT